MKSGSMKPILFGTVFTVGLSLFLQNLYSLTGRGLLGVMFGSVNGSIWETAKTVLFSYAVWSAAELLCLKGGFRRFTAARTISLCALALGYIGAMLCLSFFNPDFGSASACAVGAVCCVLALLLSRAVMNSGCQAEKLFYPAVFVLLLFVSVYFSFTPFPPKLCIFADRATGLYGIIPDNIGNH